jgi:hypothetical protein
MFKPGDYVKSIIYPFTQYEIIEVLANGSVRIRNRFFGGLERTISPQILVLDLDEEPGEQTPHPVS